MSHDTDNDGQFGGAAYDHNVSRSERTNMKDTVSKSEYRRVAAQGGNPLPPQWDGWIRFDSDCIVNGVSVKAGTSWGPFEKSHNPERSDKKQAPPCGTLVERLMQLARRDGVLAITGLQATLIDAATAIEDANTKAKNERVTNDQSDEALRAIAHQHARQAYNPTGSGQSSVCHAEMKAQGVIFCALKEALARSSTSNETPSDEEITKVLFAYEGALSEQDDDQDGLTKARNDLVELMRRLRRASIPRSASSNVDAERYRIVRQVGDWSRNMKDARTPEAFDAAVDSKERL